MDAHPHLMVGADELLPLTATCLLLRLDEDHDLHFPILPHMAEGEEEIPPHTTEEEWERDVSPEVQAQEDIREVEARDYEVYLAVEGIDLAGEDLDHQAMITGTDSEVDHQSLVIDHHTHAPPLVAGLVHH